jgi:hypothetical protein
MNTASEFIRSLSLKGGPESKLLELLEKNAGSSYNLQQMTSKLDNMEQALAATGEDISHFQETIRHFLSGLFNQRNQKAVIDSYLVEIYCNQDQR